MKKKFKIIIVCLALGLLAILVTIAYEHRGFFVYHYDIITSPELASNQTELLNLVSKDPRQAFKRFREILQATPIAHNTCHGIAHQMGHKAFEIFGFQKAMSYQEGICGGGYIHGIIEARFGLLQEKDIIGQLPTICEVGNGSCYHGIGHGLMIATKLNTVSALSYCDLLPSLGRGDCYDGVWMHVFDLEESGTHEVVESLTATAEKLPTAMIDRCKNTGRTYKTSCYFYLPRIYAHLDEVSFANYNSLCEAVEATYKMVCAAGVGHTLMKYHIDNPPTTFDRCASFATPNLVAACKEGATLYYLFDKDTMAETALTTIEQDQQCAVFVDKEDIEICKKVNLRKKNL